jgi:uncharacterized membrane protein
MALLRRPRTAGAEPGPGPAARGAHVARRGLFMLARLVMLITAVIVGLIVLAILLTVLEANESNTIVQAIQDAANFFVGPFESIFSLSNSKVEVAVNYGLAAVVYFIIGSLIARLLRR